MISREPVVTSAVIVGLILSFLTFASQRGWIQWTGEDATALQQFLEYAVPLLIVGVGAVSSRFLVTPVKDPRDNNGNPLVPK